MTNQRDVLERIDKGLEGVKEQGAIYYSIDELKEIGIELRDCPSPKIHRSARFEFAKKNTTSLILEGDVEIGEEALVIIDDKMLSPCVIKNSTILSKARIWNSPNLIYTVVEEGGQVLFVNMVIDPAFENSLSSDERLVIVKGGASFDEANYAQIRGGVIKRVELELSKRDSELIVPSGHSVISPKELEDKVRRFTENANVSIPYRELPNGNILIQSGFCHPQKRDSLFDPAKFLSIEYISNCKFMLSKQFYTRIGNKILHIDLTRLRESKDENIAQAEQIKLLSDACDFLVFKLREGGFIVVKKAFFGDLGSFFKVNKKSRNAI